MHRRPCHESSRTTKQLSLSPPFPLSILSLTGQELRARLQQIQDMLALQDPRESVPLWAQLRAAERRLEELVAQHHLATLPIDPLRPRPAPQPVAPLDMATLRLHPARAGDEKEEKEDGEEEDGHGDNDEVCVCVLVYAFIVVLVLMIGGAY